MKLQLPFYQNENTLEIAHKLIGKVIVTNFGNAKTSGIIIETEAYTGIVDKASHAYNNKRTARTEVMFGNPGIAYVYLCYGIHSLFNVVTNKPGEPHAVLIRNIKPYKGIAQMLQRRGHNKLTNKLTTGPGTVSQALGIHYSNSGESLLGNKIWIEDCHIKLDKTKIKVTPRIGVSYAGDHALLPYRFVINSNDIN